MAKLIVELPDEIHRDLKKTVMLRHQTIREVVMALVSEYLLSTKQKKKIKETGLCGKWEDKRDAESIISDIKAHRTWFQKGDQ